MNKFLAADRVKWIFAIGLMATVVGLAAKNVISYPAECIPEEISYNRDF